ncbi:MAG: hypothetical protein KAJ32_02860 [Gammaproteobacteria bacterium]|nr:hypothetical protein [Gammaproteobacteria bacterium]
MKLLSMDGALLRRRILRLNVVAGLLVAIVAVVLSVTGEYSNLADREAAESVFNLIALGGVLYAAFAWMFCVMSKPFWFPVSDKNKT